MLFYNRKSLESDTRQGALPSGITLHPESSAREAHPGSHHNLWLFATTHRITQSERSGANYLLARSCLIGNISPVNQ
jgi:hypothetical protein